MRWKWTCDLIDKSDLARFFSTFFLGIGINLLTLTLTLVLSCSIFLFSLSIARAKRSLFASQRVAICVVVFPRCHCNERFPPLWWIVDANVLPRFKHRRSSSQTQWYRRSKAGLLSFKQARVDMMSRWLKAKEGKKERCKKGWHSRRGEGQTIARERPRPRWRKTTWRVSEDNVVMQGWSGRKGEWVRGRKKEEWKRNDGENKVKRKGMKKKKKCNIK